jgi:hypothetical protein
VAQTLAEMVQNKVDAGTLPREDAVKLWAGMGSGNACTVCDQPIDSSQAEYELEYDGRPAVRLHAECHAAWDAKRKPPAVAAATASLSAAPASVAEPSSDGERAKEQRPKRRRGRRT